MVSRGMGHKIGSMLLAVMLLLPIFSHGVYAAETKEQKKVRIGYMMYDGYQNGSEGETKTGSAYEYYQKIKYYTNWEYEYVYGSFSEMYEMLENGEIDILACMTYSKEREEKVLFSDEAHGSETYYLYVHMENSEITPAKLQTLNGKSIGVTYGSEQEQYLRAWCQENQINCKIVTYKYMEDLREALTNKEIDAMVDVCVHSDGTEIVPWKSIYRFKSEDLYFAVTKNRPDLLKELNDAQAYIVSADEYYAYDTMKKYHGGISHYNTYLTPRQQEYIENCGTLQVGYLEGTNPLSFTDTQTGKMSGLCAEYLDIMTQTYGVSFETHVYTDEYQLIEDLQNEKLDIIFPLGMGYWSAEELNVALSSSICALPMTAIYKDTEIGNTFDTVVVNQKSLTQEGYVKQFYPDAKIYYVSNTTEALTAVEKGMADVYYVRSSSLEYLEQKFRLYDKFRTMSVRDDMEAFMATRTDDTILSIILDKGISLLTFAQRESAMFRYTYDIGKVSLIEAIKDNLEIVAGIGIILILLCAVLMFVSRLQTNKAHMKLLVAEKEKAEKAERAKTEFLSQMSHDIRTPMNAILGFTNFIKEESNLEVIKEDYVPKIEVASNHLVMLINDVLEMSRIETGKLTFQRDNHDIKGIIESVVTVMRMQAEEKELTLDTEFAVTERVVYCDQTYLSRVIMNLLSNAVKFTPNGGRVSVSVRQQPEAPEGHVSYEIKVSDTGIGMEPEFLKKVFEPFERARTSTISGLQGTGLGMAIVKNIVETAGDTIQVESTVGEGTTFTLNITLRVGNAKELGKLIETEDEGMHHSLEQLKDYFKGRRILLVEDNEFNSFIAYTLLENAGFLVETAENGEVAVHKVVDAPVSNYYDAILMDIQMPVMDGYEATRAIRALGDERAKVSIIAVTANAFETDRDKAKEAGMDGHVSKPIDVDNLYQTLLNVTNKK